jgi:hypothetical protein
VLQNAPLQVAKWVKIPLLLDFQEMENLLQQIPPFKVYDVQKVTATDEGIYAPGYFLDKYGAYVTYLKRGEIPPLSEFRSIFSAVWSVTEEAISSMPAPKERRLLKATQPSVQTQINQIRYAAEEKVFRTQVYSSDSICWGIQIGFPHLFLNPETFEASKTRDFPNMALFSAIQRWVRSGTLPTPFLVNGERINSPIRIGKECLPWIASHPQLKGQGIAIDRR